MKEIQIKALLMSAMIARLGDLSEHFEPQELEDFLNAHSKGVSIEAFTSHEKFPEISFTSLVYEAENNWFYFQRDNSGDFYESLHGRDLRLDATK